jgi:hypothetical protein
MNLNSSANASNLSATIVVAVCEDSSLPISCSFRFRPLRLNLPLGWPSFLSGDAVLSSRDLKRVADKVASCSGGVPKQWGSPQLYALILMTVAAPTGPLPVAPTSGATLSTAAATP